MSNEIKTMIESEARFRDLVRRRYLMDLERDNPGYAEVISSIISRLAIADCYQGARSPVIEIHKSLIQRKCRQHNFRAVIRGSWAEETVLYCRDDIEAWLASMALDSPG